MTRILHHRGPDQQAFVTDAEYGVGFGSTRLALLDLSPAGHQPMDDGRYLMSYNGEVYNYLDLREQLVTEGIDVQGTGDTAVVFAAMKTWGPSATLTRLRGMFAIAFFDRHERELILARDRFGIKPLTWTEDSGGLYWASEAKALGQVLSRPPDRVKALLSLAGIAEKSPVYTMFEGIQQVPPGHYLSAGRGRAVSMNRYYDVAAEVDEAFYRHLAKVSDEGLTDRLQELLRRSVRSMLAADAPVGVFVSGGIDSGVVAALAGESSRDVVLFTANIVGALSEVENARRLAEFTKTRLEEEAFVADRFLSELPRATYHYDAPIIYHTNAVPFAAVAALARRSAHKAVLTGEAADELFLGYPKAAMRPLRNVIGAPLEFVRWLYSLSPRLNSYVLDPTLEEIRDVIASSGQDFEPTRLASRAAECYPFLAPKSAEREYRSIHMMSGHLLSLLHRNDRMGMQASIESRFPFLDEDVVRFALNMPSSRKAGLQRRLGDRKHPFVYSKAPVRNLAHRLLPLELATQPKRGFPMVGHAYLRCRPGVFKGGYFAELVGLSDNGEAEMLRTVTPYVVAKAVSLDVFGRIFGHGDSVEEVGEHLRRFVTLSRG